MSQAIADDQGPVAAPRSGPAATLATLVPMDHLGTRLKELRLNAGLSLRELARQADVSPSLVSQIENGKSRPSVSTLYSFAQLLNVSVDELFDTVTDAAVDLPADPAAPPGGVQDGVHDPANAWHPSEYATRISVMHPSHRAHLRMAEGVDWERLAATPERDVNFMKITYAPGAAGTADGSLIAHDGYEYGFVLAGIIQVTVGDEVFVLREGESLGFDSTIPHVLRNIGDVDFQGLWFVHGSRH
jgi:transcriptional regulator with XRE-family HTH domain